MAKNVRFNVDMLNDSTLAISILTAFHAEARKYGVRLAGIEDDVNEHMDFFLQVARSLIADNTSPTGPDDARDA